MRTCKTIFTQKTNKDKEIKILQGKLIVFIIENNYKALLLPTELRLSYSKKTLSRALKFIIQSSANIGTKNNAKLLINSIRKEN